MKNSKFIELKFKDVCFDSFRERKGVEREWATLSRKNGRSNRILSCCTNHRGRVIGSFKVAAGPTSVA